MRCYAVCTACLCVGSTPGAGNAQRMFGKAQQMSKMAVAWSSGMCAAAAMAAQHHALLKPTRCVLQATQFLDPGGWQMPLPPPPPRQAGIKCVQLLS
jgi:hypothetical protein